MIEGRAVERLPSSRRTVAREATIVILTGPPSVAKVPTSSVAALCPRSPMRYALLALALAAACDKPPATPTPTADHAPAAVPPTSATPSAPAAAHPSTDPAPPPAGALPPGHPPIAPTGSPHGAPPPGAPGAGPMAAAVPAETGVDRPLPLEGGGSVAELRARLAKVKDSTKHPVLEDAFRKTFTVDRAARDVSGAEALLTPLAQDPDPAIASLAERTLGYVRVSSGFDQEGAKARYARALELDPDYGEAHYAQAFMLAMGDRAAGKVHFDRAMALGVPDTRGLKEQFYGQ